MAHLRLRSAFPSIVSIHLGEVDLDFSVLDAVEDEVKIRWDGIGRHCDLLFLRLTGFSEEMRKLFRSASPEILMTGKSNILDGDISRWSRRYKWWRSAREYVVG
jgi:hypothetical protein